MECLKVVCRLAAEEEDGGLAYDYRLKGEAGGLVDVEE